MKRLVVIPLLMMGASITAQNTPPATTPPAVVSVIESVTGKQFQPDTAYAALTKEDASLLAEAPVANWGLAQESGNMVYYNLIIGTRSYQLLVMRPPRSSYPTATLLRFTTPKSKPEAIARGLLRPAKEEKPR
ncbi:hypothetical protein WBJ53_27255 [Spirosoma sp. SC4-14]|uniref:hypothetical protein n=1 Tax=Spirosoma sp. SC4-14 TaxID=3128900 RepID=UPI0030CD1E14